MDNLTNLFGKILNLEEEHPPQALLKENSLKGIVDFIRDKKVSNIIVMSGAGLSTAAGIPDFRSPKSGLYSNLSEYHLPYPEAVFDISFFKTNPEPFFKLAKSLWPENLKPTLAHYFIRLLNDKGLLLRNYTQNIDTLECLAGLPPDKLVEAHGTFRNGKCMKCGKSYGYQWIKKAIAGSNPSSKNNCDDNATMNYTLNHTPVILSPSISPENLEECSTLSASTNLVVESTVVNEIKNIDNIIQYDDEKEPPHAVTNDSSDLPSANFKGLTLKNQSSSIINTTQSSPNKQDETKMGVVTVSKRRSERLANKETSTNLKANNELSQQRQVKNETATSSSHLLIPRCESPNCGGIVKPNIVFFGESLPTRFFSLLRSDFARCDLLIIMGTSLVVQPFASLVDYVSAHTPRVLINKERPHNTSIFARLFGMPKGMDLDPHHKHSRDIFYQGTCDDGCEEFARLLGWETELEKLRQQPLPDIY